MGYIGTTTGAYWDNIGILEKKMETTIWGLGFPKIRRTFKGAPKSGLESLGGLYWGPPILGLGPGIG